MFKSKYFLIPVSFFLGAALSLSGVFGAVSPFAATAVLCLPTAYAVPAAIGSLAAGVLFNGMGAIAQAAAVGAAVICRLRHASPDVRDCALSAGVYAPVGAAVTVFSGGGLPEILSYIICSLLYFYISSSFVKASRRLNSADPVPTRLLLVCLFGAVCGLSGCGKGVLNAGAVLGACSVLFASVRSGPGVGALTAAAASLAIGLHSPADFSSMAILLVPALICGFTSFGSPVKASAVMLLTVSPAVILFGPNVGSIGLIADCAIASAVFVITYPTASRLYSEYTADETTKQTTYRRERLNAALSGISERLYRLSVREIKQGPSYSDEVFERVCAGCESLKTCKGEGLGSTEKLTDSADFYRALPTCTMIPKITKAGAEIKRRKEYVTLKASENRTLARYCSDMLLCMEKILGDLDREYLKKPGPDRLLSLRLEKALKKYGLKPISSAVYKSGRAEAAFHLSQNPGDVRLCSIVSEITGFDYEKPERTALNEEAVYTLTPRAEYYADPGVCQLSATKEPSGDVADSFTVGSCFYSVLSDGMGRGGEARAAALSLVTVLKELIASGFEPDTAIELGSLVLKASVPEETLATVDMLKFDLRTGFGEFFKAGGCVSYLSCDGVDKKIRGGGYPAGIINPCGVVKQRFSVRDSAGILMMTDGACGIKYESFLKALSDEKTLPPDDAAALILGHALEENTSQTDDISVSLIKIGKNRR